MAAKRKLRVTDEKRLISAEICFMDVHPFQLVKNDEISVMESSAIMDFIALKGRYRKPKSTSRKKNFVEILINIFKMVILKQNTWSRLKVRKHL
jgi:hypothetical protein